MLLSSRSTVVANITVHSFMCFNYLFKRFLGWRTKVGEITQLNCSASETVRIRK